MLMATILPWRNALWRKTMCGLQHSETDLGRRRWDESLQAHIDNVTGETVTSKGQEACLVARITHKQASSVQLAQPPPPAETEQNDWI